MPMDVQVACSEMLSPTFLNDSPGDIVSNSHSVLFPIPEAIELELYLEGQGNFSLSDSIQCLDHESYICRASPGIPNDTNSNMSADLPHREYLQSLYEEKESYLTFSKEDDIEMKLGLLERKIEKESSNIQHNQDGMIKNILDRKNTEAAGVKTYFHNKVIELESAIEIRDKDVASLTAESSEMQKVHEQEIKGLEDAIRMNEYSKIDEYEIRIRKKNHIIAEMEKVHKKTIDQLLEEKNANLSNMKNELNKNKDLKSAITMLKEKLVNENKFKDKVIFQRDFCKDKEGDLLIQINQLQLEILEKDERISYVENANKELISKHECEVSDIRQRLQGALDEMKKEQASSALKTSSKIAELESKILYYETFFREKKEQKDFYEKKLTDLGLSENKKMQKLQNVIDRKELEHKQQVVKIESSLRSQIQKVLNELEVKNLAYIEMNRKYESQLEERNKFISKLENKLIAHMKEAESSVNLLKIKTEKKNSKTSRELNEKLQQSEQSLNSARGEIIKQKNEYNLQLEEEKNKYAMRLSKYKAHFETFCLKLQEKHNKDVSESAGKLSRQKLEYEERIQGLLPLSIKADLESTIDSMRQQIHVLQSQVDVLQDELKNTSNFHHLDEYTA